MTGFYLLRKRDVNGVSGEGIIAEGVIFSNGKVAMSWLTKPSSVGVYENIEDIEQIHGHQGATRIVTDIHDLGEEEG